jgi:hypothetical protein
MIDHMGIFFVVFIAIAAILANIGVWAPRKTWVRIGAVAAAALFIPAAYASVADLLSRPKPVSIEWVHRNAKEATVLGSRITNGKAIYLWLQLPDESQPRAYVLPYSEKVARQLHEAQAEARQKGTQTKMKHPFNRRHGKETAEEQFFAPPQPQLPRKSRDSGSPIDVPRSQGG